MFTFRRTIIFSITFLALWLLNYIISVLGSFGGNDSPWGVVIIFPGLIFLFPLIISTEKTKARWCAVGVSLLTIIAFNFWTLSPGNKELILYMITGDFFIFLFFVCETHNKLSKGIFFAIGLIFFLFSAFEILRQLNIENKFTDANICIIYDGGSCGSTCYEYVVSKMCSSNKYYNADLFHSEGFVTIRYGYKQNTPIVYLGGPNYGTEYTLFELLQAK